MSQSGVNTTKQSLPTFIVSNTDITHFLPPCLKDKTNQSDYPLSPQALVLFYWAKAGGLSRKQIRAPVIKLQMRKLLFKLSTPCSSFFLFYNFSFPLQSTAAPKASNILRFAKISASWLLSQQNEVCFRHAWPVLHAPTSEIILWGCRALLWMGWGGNWAEVSISGLFTIVSWKHNKSIWIKLNLKNYCLSRTSIFQDIKHFHLRNCQHPHHQILYNTRLSFMKDYPYIFKY